MDSLDQEIINVLRLDGRIAFVDIAKKLDVSSGIVQARYNKMKKNGVIKVSTLILDYKKIGLVFNASIGIKAIDSELGEVINYVNGLKIEEAEIFSFITFGRYNITVAIFSKNLLQAHKLVQLIQRHPSVLKVNISLSFLDDDETLMEKYSDQKQNRTQTIDLLDKIDAEMLQILCKDARAPFSKIAKALGISTQTVFRKFERLQKNGVISGSSVILSCKALGIKGNCGLYVKLKPDASMPITRNKIASISQSIVVHPKWGEYDFHITSTYCDFKEITGLIANLRKLREILTIELMIYTLDDDGSIPFILTFERGLPEWALAAKC